MEISKRMAVFKEDTLGLLILIAFALFMLWAVMEYRDNQIRVYNYEEMK